MPQPHSAGALVPALVVATRRALRRPGKATPAGPGEQLKAAVPVCRLSFRPYVVRALPLLAAFVVVAALATALMPRGAKSASAVCNNATSLELVGTGTPSSPVIDLTGNYSAAEASISGLGNPQTISVLVPLDFELISLEITGCTIEYDSAGPSVAISATATDILPGDPPLGGHLLILATWDGQDPVVSLGGHVDGDFDLARVDSHFVAPDGLKPEFSEVWFTQSSGEQTPPGAYAGAGRFYPAGHVIPPGVAFRGEVELRSVIGDRLAERLGYAGGMTLSILGGVPVQGGVTIYNDTLVVQNQFTLEGQIDLSGVNGLPAGISFPSGQPWTLTLDLKTTATNARGNLATFGIQVGVQGWMTIDKSLLNMQNDLLLEMEAKFEWDQESEFAIVDFAVTAQGPWSGLFGMNGFVANSVTVALRASTKPDAQAARITVTGVFTVNGFEFALTFAISEKNQQFSAKVTAEALSDISLAQLVGALADLDRLDQVGISGDDSWSALEGITLTRLKAAVSFGQAGATVFVIAEANVLEIDARVAFYLGPDKQENSPKYGFFLGAYVGDASLADFLYKAGIQNVPGILDITLPQTIFYVGSLKFDADRLGFPDPDLFDFINEVYGTSGAPGEKIAVEAGAGLLANVDTSSIPQDVRDALREYLWMDFDAGVSVQGNIPLFGKKGFSLFLYLPKVQPGPNDKAPEWFEGAQLHLSFSLDQQSISFKAQGELDVRLRKEGVPRPETLANIVYEDYDHLAFMVAGDIAISTTVEANLTGQVKALSGEFHPLGLDWLTFQQLAIVLNIGTTQGGNAKIGLGLGGAIVLGEEPNQLDLEASFLIGVQTLQVFPWATANIDGIRFATSRGLETDDLVRLAELTWPGHSLGINPQLLAGLPNIGINNFEVSFSKVDNVPLCLRKGFTLTGNLFVNTQLPPYEPRPPCDYSRENKEVDPRDPPGLNCNGCLAGIDIEIVLPGANAPKIKGLFSLSELKLGDSVSIGPATIDLEISQEAVHLMVSGQMTLDGVLKGSVDLVIKPDGFHFLGYLGLFPPDPLFQVKVQGDASFSLSNPTFHLDARIESQFGQQWEPIVAPFAERFAAAVTVINGLVTVLNDQQTGFDDVLYYLTDIPQELQRLGLSGPLINTLADVSTAVNNARSAAGAVGFNISVDSLINVALGGLDIQITPAIWGYNGVFGCRPALKNFNCILIPATYLHIPGICPNVVNVSPCNAVGLKNAMVAGLNDILAGVLGISPQTLQQKLATIAFNFKENPVVFDVTCAGFTLDLAPNQTVGKGGISLMAKLVILGTEINVGPLTWNFGGGIEDNLTGLVGTLGRVLTGSQGSFDCLLEAERNTPPPPPRQPSDLVQSPSPATVNEGGTAAVTGSFNRGTVPDNETQIVTIRWPGYTETIQVLAPSQSFTSAGRPFADDNPTNTPSDVISVPVTVTNSAGSTSAVFKVKVNNVAPAGLTLSTAPSPINEGSTITLNGSFTDVGVLDAHVVTVKWGDGAQDRFSLAAGVFSFGQSHAYADDNPTATSFDTHAITVTVTDDDTGSATGSVQQTVNNVAPTLDTGSLQFNTVRSSNDDLVVVERDVSSVIEGQLFELVGSFSDPGTGDTHKVEVDWGDGTKSTVDTTPSGGTTHSFRVPYQYDDDNPTGTQSDTMTIRVRIVDDDGGESAQGTRTLTVNNVAPVVSIDSVIDENGAEIGTDVDVAVIATLVRLTGSFTDVGPEDTHTASIAWGDGTFDDLGAAAGSVTASHTYAAPCHCTITLTVIDDDLGVGIANREIEVVDASDAIANVVDHLLALGSDPNLLAAVNKLRGDNGGLGANGALDMLEKGNLTSAVEKIKQALLYLEVATIDIAPAQKGLLALAAKSVAVVEIWRAEAVATSPKDVSKVQEAKGLVAQGDSRRLALDFIGAVGKYLDAVKQVQGIRR